MRIVAVVGNAPETRERANDLPADVEVWGMNEGHKFQTRYDRWFQLHPFVWANRPMFGRNEAHMAFLESCGVPVYMKYPYPLPTRVEYPTEAVVGSIGRRYLTSTAAHLIALAIHECVDELRLYGVNLASNTEYVEQRPCIEWLLGLAEGRGIKVEVPADSPLLFGEEYPQAADTPLAVARRRLDERRQSYFGYWQRVCEAQGAVRALSNGASLPLYLVALQEQRDHLLKAQGKMMEAKFWLHHMGGFDRNVSIMPGIPVGLEYEQKPREKAETGL